MQRVRVVVANKPRLIRELIVSTIADQSDIEIVGEVGNQADLVEIVEQVRPDVLILAMDDHNDYRIQCGFLLGRHPEMRILALAPNKNRAVFYWATVEVRSTPLESSEDGILNAVRQRPPLVGLARV
jgi:AmiR/NasT family two-component response regulator